MPGPDDNITLGEIWRRLDSLERRFDVRATELGNKIDSLQFVHKDTYEAEKHADRTRLDAIEERLRFYGRTMFVQLGLPILVALILAVVLTQ